MQEDQISKYPNTFFRVSLKAVIENEEGEILCVKEAGSDWTLPGGGLDHGETIENGLRRELFEEVALAQDTPFLYQPIGHDIMWVDSRQAWQLWVIFRVTFDVLPQFSKGVDADDVQFINPQSFKDSPYRAQQLIYKWLVDPL
ncbi:MAG TPA: NUDIX domain-containing protein [Candidatus Saccharibacteria bacterium]|nr:NUDIX domain-containing protein [Candidatus Saccharibacteria bacterium]